jgi:hypothetical protein
MIKIIASDAEFGMLSAEVATSPTFVNSESEIATAVDLI